jgi:hypothetical protein
VLTLTIFVLLYNSVFTKVIVTVKKEWIDTSPNQNNGKSFLNVFYVLFQLVSQLAILPFDLRENGWASFISYYQENYCLTQVKRTQSEGSKMFPKEWFCLDWKKDINQIDITKWLFHHNIQQADCMSLSSGVNSKDIIFHKWLVMVR